MKDIEYICKKVLDKVSGAIACGLVDLKKKDLLELHHLQEFTPTRKVAVISGMIYLLSGKLTSGLEQAVQTQFGILSEGNVDHQEIQVTFDQLFCFCKTIKKGKIGLILITKQNSDVELAWSELKSLVPVLETIIS